MIVIDGGTLQVSAIFFALHACDATDGNVM